ncbi:MAG TPA: hypothetical protein VK281_17610, partial [Xanthobacteraceae bacterium]|nr:hypothetical protein [Xanthobacteraceae bacterium]
MDVSACTSIPNTTETAISPLIRFALRGLKRCWLPQQGRWSFAYHLDGRPNPNESRPGYDVYYTLNVLLGLSRLAKTGYLPPLDLRAVFIENALAMVDLPVPRYAYGMALWASAELGQTLPNPALAAARRLIADGSGWRRWRAQDLGMMLSGTVSQARTDRKLWSDPAHRLFRFLRERFCSGSGLFFDQASGLRRRWASFATQTYLTLACYHYGELFGDRNAIGVANRCAAKLISLQGPDGEWPWFYDVPRGCIVDWYEVYSVHQDGMAPAFLEHAEPHGVRGATEALSRGFVWIYGNNQLGQ